MHDTPGTVTKPSRLRQIQSTQRFKTARISKNSDLLNHSQGEGSTSAVWPKRTVLPRHCDNIEINQAKAKCRTGAFPLLFTWLGLCRVDLAAFGMNVFPIETWYHVEIGEW